MASAMETISIYCIESASYCIESASTEGSGLAIRRVDHHCVPLFTVTPHPLYDGAHRHSGGPISDPGLALVVPRATCDVEVYPGGLASELLEEHRRSDGAAPAVLARIHDVCDL